LLRPGRRYGEVEADVRAVDGGESLVVIRDVTREANLERQMWQAQKMEAVGRLAGGVAHDFNNLLTSIIGFAQLIHEQLPPDHPSARDVEEILHAGDRATRLTQQLLTFSRKQIVETHPLDPKALIMSLDKLLRQTIGEDIELVVLLDPDTPAIEADDSLLEQALVNLAINARDAMPRGGKLTLSTGAVRLDGEFCASRMDILPGEYTLITVRDTGVGMDPSVRAHLFEPFFTTKQKGKGTGLGLSIVYGVVRQFNGFVEVDTAPGEGAEFRLYFPAASAPVSVAAASAIEPVRGGEEQILIVEDEQALRQLVARILQSYGYRVLEARNGEEGLAVFLEAHPPPDLVLSDIVMPRKSGPKMVEELRSVRPDLRVLYMSGFVGEFAGGREMQLGAPLVMKPFTAETIARHVRRALDADRRRSTGEGREKP
jgi:signal transduction histidine kinase/CheY-like chemotaxis protein